jgi:hypothetical protein
MTIDNQLLSESSLMFSKPFNFKIGEILPEANFLNFFSLQTKLNHG